MTTSPSRKRLIRAAAWTAAGLTAAAAVAALIGTGRSAPAETTFTALAGWKDGYAGEYLITNPSRTALSDWTLEFDLPTGTTITSLWNGTPRVSGRHVTVRPGRHGRPVPPHGSIAVGYVASVPGTAERHPTGCRFDGVSCASGGGGRGAHGGAAGATTSRTTAGFAPYAVESSDLAADAEATGVTLYNLAFVTDSGGCSPAWDDGMDLDEPTPVQRVGALRAAGGDVRISFGGESGPDLAAGCRSASATAAAYRRVIDTYHAIRADFDVEGDSLTDAAAVRRQVRAIASLQRSRPGLAVSFTLPVMPDTGLPQEAVGLLAEARAAGVSVAAVNIMAMDYDDSYRGDMADFAFSAATIAHAQIESVLGLSDTAAWRTLAVTPMIGVNDIAGEVFTLRDAARLVTFARAKGIGWLSMWAAERDLPCPDGPDTTARTACSSVAQDDHAFAETLAAYRGPTAGS